MYADEMREVKYKLPNLIPALHRTHKQKQSALLFSIEPSNSYFYY